MFRKKAKPAIPKDPDEMRERMARAQPGLDARLEGEDMDAPTRAHVLVLRALTHLAAGDHASALADADAASAIGLTTVEQERHAAIVLAQAVAALGLADRREEALARVQALDLGPVEPARRQLFRIQQVRLLTSLGRANEALALMKAQPMIVEPGPGYPDRLLARAQVRLLTDDPEGALEDVDAALAAGLGAERTRVAANLGAYAIAVLGREDRVDEALAWANLACTPGMGGGQAGLAERDTRAAVLAVAGRGAEAVADLAAGLAATSAMDPTGPAAGWSHAFLARAHLDAGSADRARHHADEATRLGARTPVLDAVRRRLAEGPAASGGPSA